MNRAIFPGTFDPFTIGHFTIVQRGLKMFDEIVVGIGVNNQKKTLLSVEKRLDIINQAFTGEQRVKAETYDCLTVDFAKKINAEFILRGLRSVSDFEYERTIADTNRILTGIETVILFTEADYAHISSTMARDLLSYGKDISEFLPPKVRL